MYVFFVPFVCSLFYSRANSAAFTNLSGKDFSISRNSETIGNVARNLAESSPNTKITRIALLKMKRLSRLQEGYNSDSNDRTQNFTNLRGDLEKYHFHQHGCEFYDGFHFEGEVWHSRGCRRHKCLFFKGKYFVETDSCDTEIYNTTYRCVVEADLQKDFPYCCPRYTCNPDNLGNRVNVIGAK